jgi:predicted DsbA family dithiol-disulfide isomerase
MDSWLFLHVPGKPEVDLSEGAAAIGLDVAAFETCVTAEATYARANEERRAAFKRRIRNTPTYVLEGKRLDAAEIHEQLDLAL